MTFLAAIKDKLADRKAKKARRASMSFNASSGGGRTKHVRPEPPGSRVGGGGSGGSGGAGGV